MRQFVGVSKENSIKVYLQIFYFLFFIFFFGFFHQQLIFSTDNKYVSTLDLVDLSRATTTYPSTLPTFLYLESIRGRGRGGEGIETTKKK